MRELWMANRRKEDMTGVEKGDSMKDRLVRRGCRAVTEVDSKNEVKHIEKKIDRAF